jgi:hypothetical protein
MPGKGNSGGNVTNDRRKAKGMDNRRRCLELRLTGMTNAQIGDQLGLQRSTVCRHIKEALADIPKAEADALRGLEVEKLDREERFINAQLSARHIAWASNGKVVMDIDEKTGKPYKLEDPGPVFAAVGKLLDIANRRAKLLGLDSPTKIEQSGSVEVTTAHPDLSVLTDEEYAAYKAMNAKLRAQMNAAREDATD